uniref:Neur_chan_LBD domain-containing protein n=2 Tax=Macrostomum lignano TaxID=282301 RepID=A0A1I8H475_9PLAT
QHIQHNPTQSNTIQHNPTPRIRSERSADEKFDGTYPTNVVIEHTGNMNFIPPGMFRSTCKIDTTWFPFDTQVCKLKFGSWSYDGGTLDLRLKCSNESLSTNEMRLNDPNNCSEIGGADLETYVPSGEWYLEGNPVIRCGALMRQRPRLDSKCSHINFGLNWNLGLALLGIRVRRRRLYYLFNLIGPCIFMACLTLLSFIIPPDAGEKVSFGMDGKRTAAEYDCCPYPFIDLSYFIQIRRRTLYYGINLIIPCVLISSMSLLTFVLPPDAGVTIMLSLSMFQLLVADAMPQTSESVPLIGEAFVGNSECFAWRQEFGVTILLSLTVFLMMVAESMPPTSDAVPLIGMYFSCTMVMCSLSVVFTVIVLNYHHRDAESHPVPNWVKKFICTYLANILCMRNHHRDEEKEPIYLRRRKNASFRTSSYREAANANVELKERSSKSLLANVLDLEDDIRTVGGVGGVGVSGIGASAGAFSPPTYQNQHGRRSGARRRGGGGGGGGGGGPSCGSNCSTRNELAAVVRELQVITKKIADDTADGEISSEWKFAARVVDRLCLIIFSCFTVISTCAILFSAPDVFKG